MQSWRRSGHVIDRWATRDPRAFGFHQDASSTPPPQFQESDILLSSGSAEIEGVYPCVSTWKALWFPYSSCESGPSGTHSVTMTLPSLHHNPFEISLALGGPRDPKPDGFVL